MQTEDGIHSIECPFSDHLDRAAGNRLLRWFEQQSNPAFRLEGLAVHRQEASKSHDDRRVRVMPASVRQAGCPAPIGRIEQVERPQRVDISANGDRRSGVATVPGCDDTGSRT